MLDRWALLRAAPAPSTRSPRRSTTSTRRGPGRRLTDFVDDLSNWYVRRSRRRFWDGDPAALATLHECLEIMTRLLAPFMPFITDEVHERWFATSTDGAADSVHLQAWPDADPTPIDPALGDADGAGPPAGRARPGGPRGVRRQDPPAAGPGAGVRGRLGRAAGRAAPARRDELNVRSLDALTSAGDLVDASVKPNFRSLGKRFGQRTPEVAAAIAAADAGARWRPRCAATGTATVDVDGGPSTITADESSSPRRRAAAGRSPPAGTETVALDLELTDELRAAGTVREIVRLVQEARKAQGLEVTDRIELWWEADGETADALRRRRRPARRARCLAVTVTRGAPAAPLAPHDVAERGRPILATLGRLKFHPFGRMTGTQPVSDALYERVWLLRTG